MNLITQVRILEMFAEGLSPYKIASILDVSSYSVRYVLDWKGEREKSKARVRRWIKSKIAHA